MVTRPNLLLGGVQSMQIEKLTAANKLIFVKKFAEALVLLDELLTDPDQQNNFLVHLRKIELISGLSEYFSEAAAYRTLLANPAITPVIRLLCSGLLDLWLEEISVVQALTYFSELKNLHGESPASYFCLGLTHEMAENDERAQYYFNLVLQLDPQWYPALFQLSQLCFQHQQSEEGERYFAQFEHYAPYYLHGNFSTHKQLSAEFLAAKKFEEAETALTTLSAWWLQQKGRCPPEVKLYEHITLATIAQHRPDFSRQHHFFQGAVALAQQIIREKKTDGSSLFFLLNVFEPFSDHPRVLELCRNILERGDNDQQLLKTVASKIFASTSAAEGAAIFAEAYARHPNDEEVRFCYLLAEVKKHGLAVDKYFAAKDHYQNLKKCDTSPAELLVKLHNLNAIFNRDHEIHYDIAELYRYLGNQERAREHYQLMLTYDPLGHKTQLKYATSLLETKEFHQIISLVEQIHFDCSIDPDSFMEQRWLLSRCYFALQDYSQALKLLQTIALIDPWQVKYLTYQIMALTQLYASQLKVDLDKTLLNLAGISAQQLNWASYQQLSSYFFENNLFELVYLRSKLYLLYHSNSDSAFGQFLTNGLAFNPGQVSGDLLKLLNSSFERTQIMLGLAKIAKEQWQLETASMWYEQILQQEFPRAARQREAYIELADCYLLRDVFLAKAQQLVILARDPQKAPPLQQALILLHLFLRQGELHQAKHLLDSLGPNEDNFELTFLSGLHCFKAGLTSKARALWKPLIKVNCLSLRSNYLKKKLLELYFSGQETFSELS